MRKGTGACLDVSGQCLVRCPVLQFWEVHSRHQLVCRASRGLVLSSDASCESKGLFPGVWQHEGWFKVPDKGLSGEVEESLSGCVIFPQMKSPDCKL